MSERRGLTAACLLLAALATGACCQSAASATPEPPRRPVRNAKPPAPDASPPAAPASQKPEPKPATNNAAPQNPATATPPAPAAREPADVKPDELTPYNLPQATRQRMRLCGERWRDLKMEGRSAGLTWRSFAEKCLPGKE